MLVLFLWNGVLLVLQNLGLRISYLRRKKSLSMADLAKEIGVSRSLISQVEKGEAYPSLHTLEKITNVLDVSMSKFFEVQQEANDDENQIIVRNGYHKVISMPDSQIKYRILSPSIYNDMEFLITEVPPQNETKHALDIFRHEGMEYFYMIQGQLILTLDDHRYVLNEGDSGCFDPSLTHYFVNHTDQTAKMIIFATEPGVMI